MRPPVEDVWVSTLDASPTTVMTSLMPPTFNARSTTASRPTVRTMPRRASVPNPVSVAVTAYGPGGKSVARKCPPSPDTSSRVTPVSSFFTVTVAPGSTAPVSSETVPVIVPLAPCARAGDAPASSSSVRTSSEFQQQNISRRIRLPPARDGTLNGLVWAALAWPRRPG